MKKRINIQDWPRKEHFEFFRQFDEPFFGICTRVDVTEAYQKCKNEALSFFLYYLHCSLAAANSVEAFRYRILDGEPWLFEEVHASPTINRANGTFGFAYMDYHPAFAAFAKTAQAEIERVRAGTGLTPSTSGQNVIHYSSLPWIDFTAISHARSFSFPDSCPKITFGKMTEDGNRRTMPVAIHLHHALGDGLHVSQFLEKFQHLLAG